MVNVVNIVCSCTDLKEIIMSDVLLDVLNPLLSQPHINVIKKISLSCECMMSHWFDAVYVCVCLPCVCMCPVCVGMSCVCCACILNLC